MQAFQWDDPFLFEQQLDDDERQIRDAARAYCQDKLQPRVLSASREERFDRDVCRAQAIEPVAGDLPGVQPLASHDLGLVKRMKKRVLVLDHGQLADDIAPEDLADE